MSETWAADRVIDYKKEDVTKNGQTYHFIFDILGKGSFSQLKGLLKRKRNLLVGKF